ncbi:MAG: peptide chain release factor N(5)-glutamine methyltransferase [Gammaproteobacteria bacterium]|nr:peptide chain release factor N(5)-glutamine methyltransferase [Gammaproteobacteria bacterium]MBT8094746.1 peptide chain release factor N(5)-glutamine methyltransferase [Gammaproteobacteria bacterium]NNF50325.1 peptide chain release factor N(5)-glutamine methyltransferase [Woeseiaceae bacterium]NNL64125.1 peptide chain release factor N(5)-glutamine methyltransferase [Woeseiaceae bacterium]
MRLDAAIAAATERLRDASESPRLDAEILLGRTINMPRSYLFAHPEDELDELTLARFEDVLARREAGMPMAYIMGIREFWSREFAVSPATLVPRPETEILVNLALCEIPRDAAWEVLDLGTGSGAIAVSIACERPLCQVTAVDNSEEALAVARENARALARGNVTCELGNWAEPVQGRTFDVIVSNPPYVRRDDEHLAGLRYEPQAALVAGEDGLDAIRVLAAACGELLVDGGLLLVEHGAVQAAAVADLLGEHGWTEVACHKDLAGLPRVTAARRGGKQAPPEK